MPDRLADTVEGKSGRWTVGGPASASRPPAGCESSPERERDMEVAEVAERPAMGYRLLPHTADVVVEAWAPTRGGCLAEAVRGLVAVFADTSGLDAVRSVELRLEPAGDEELLVRLLEEVVYLVEVDALVPVDVEVDLEPGGGLRARFDVTPLTPAMIVGPVPKAIAWYELEFARKGSGWTCRATVDV